MQLLVLNEEFLVSTSHQLVLITSLPFVHTARRSYRLNDPVRPPDCGDAAGSPAAMPREAVQTLSFRGRRSRNKVSVGEPAEGSFARMFCFQQTSISKLIFLQVPRSQLIFFIARTMPVPHRPRSVLPFILQFFLKIHQSSKILQW